MLVAVYQSAEHLDLPTDATLRPTNQQVNNQPARTTQSMIHQPTNQPDKIGGHRPFIPKCEYLRFHYLNWINIDYYRTYGSPL